MSTLTAAVWVAAALLVVSGGSKVAAPHPAAAALRTARLPSHPRVVRALGVGEVALGLAVLVVGGAVTVALLGVTYGGFAVVARRQWRAESDCGCFGASRTAVTAVHVWLDVVLAACGLVVALVPGHTIPMTDLAVGQPAEAAIAAVLVVVAANLVRLLLTAAPELSATVAQLEPDAAA